ncbi:MAG: DUF3592 domain-containing protein, partial [Anaerolineae bacterium]|nr:DUF3592 domain-containing protein [Anaerolineae bacterium]
LDPSSEKANLWMATVQDDKDQREYYIQRVLEINPRNRIAPYLRRVRTPEERLAQEEFQSETQFPQRGRFLRTLLPFTAFSLLIMGIMIFGLVKEYQANTFLAENGRQASAVITNKTERYDGEDTFYYLWFAFDAVENGETVPYQDVSSEVSKAVYDVVQVGDVYDVTYLPDDPTVAQLSKLANSPVLKEQFTRQLILYALFATVPIDIAVIGLLMQKAKRKKRE